MKWFNILICLVVLTACNNKTKENVNAEKGEKPVFEMVDVPTLIVDKTERADYLIDHYWDKFDFTDTTYIHYPEVTEQAFSNFLGFLPYAHPEKVSPAIKKMLKKAEAEPKMYAYFTDLYEHYLYDPNSMMRNEELYIIVLETIVESPLLGEDEKIRPAHLLKLALKNRLGESATDFAYTLPDGKKGKLYGVSAERLILYFYNPDCDACRETTRELQQSTVIKGLMAEKKVKILAVYPDEDLQAWKEHLEEMPGDWILSYDKEVKLKNEEIYDLKAIPCLYLLDKNKVVLLKDAPFEQVEAFLYNSQL
ncbi:thiol-disulfide isomerase/thioredoxin [Parabacteroides sp. PFB2-10]|uniref:DUF5106 domain-containing protein n=1 Tax=Parabacteroides sp. PFB2-10 TaxID=1742405 RepID=UPI002473448D|nr:DUF5106 domain-containing protein [Parabacteroides sp. PFB2-10]MDH6311732.1 thiol-disulfide isomerase/thioredoxin [Parabacteroides sp. PFB2-10]